MKIIVEDSDLREAQRIATAIETLTGIHAVIQRPSLAPISQRTKVVPGPKDRVVPDGKGRKELAPAEIVSRSPYLTADETEGIKFLDD